MTSVVVEPVRSLAPLPTERVRGRASGLAHALASRVYLPACSIVALAGVLVGIGWANRWGGADFTASMTDLRVVVIGPVTLVIIAVFLVVERVRPAQRRPLLARGHRQDILFTLLNATLTVPLVSALTLTFSEVARRAIPWIVLPRIGAVPRWAAIGAIFVLMDGCNWFAHLANHRVRMLWRFHEVHHSQEDLNVLTVFRTHPLIHVSYLIALLPGIVLVANGALTTGLLVVYGGVVAFAHSNTNLGFGPLGRIFVSPNFHRLHHKLDGPQDVNLGFALTIWDQMFHRAVFPTPETIRTDTGLPGRPLIVEQAGARPRHLSVFAAQLLGPFRPMTDRTALLSVRSREVAATAHAPLWSPHRRSPAAACLGTLRTIRRRRGQRFAGDGTAPR
ncbi:MAG TPA: sterol desaturase family protein [Acidimicrobiales bacterium]|nr:sterol desaturase family protein [Acidimicrobiales bacterium]